MYPETAPFKTGSGVLPLTPLTMSLSVAIGPSCTSTYGSSVDIVPGCLVPGRFSWQLQWVSVPRATDGTGWEGVVRVKSPALVDMSRPWDMQTAQRDSEAWGCL